MPSHKQLTICKHVHDLVLKRDPYAFQNDVLCSCHYMCKLKSGDKFQHHFPKDYKEFVKVVNIILKQDDIK